LLDCHEGRLLIGKSAKGSPDRGPGREAGTNDRVNRPDPQIVELAKGNDFPLNAACQMFDETIPQREYDAATAAL
jgi:hypothetical protein